MSTAAAIPWEPSPDGQVATLAVARGTVYAGGEFLNISGVVRSKLAALDTISGLTKSFIANANLRVNALVVSGPTLYVGGQFTSMKGAAAPYFCAVDAGTGAIKGWNPNLNNPVSAIVAAGSNLYLDGSFTSNPGTTSPRSTPQRVQSLIGTPTPAVQCTRWRSQGLPCMWEEVL